MSALSALDGSAAAQTTSQIQAIVMRQVLDVEQHQAAAILQALPAPPPVTTAPERRGSSLDVYA